MRKFTLFRMVSQKLRMIGQKRSRDPENSSKHHGARSFLSVICTLPGPRGYRRLCQSFGGMQRMDRRPAWYGVCAASRIDGQLTGGCEFRKTSSNSQKHLRNCMVSYRPLFPNSAVAGYQADPIERVDRIRLKHLGSEFSPDSPLPPPVRPGTGCRRCCRRCPIHDICLDVG